MTLQDHINNEYDHCGNATRSVGEAINHLGAHDYQYALTALHMAVMFTRKAKQSACLADRATAREEPEKP